MTQLGEMLVTINVHDTYRSGPNTVGQGTLSEESLRRVREAVRQEIEHTPPVQGFQAAAATFLAAIDNVIPILETELEQLKEHRLTTAMMLAHPPTPGVPHGNVSVFSKPSRPAPGVRDAE